MIWLVLTVTYNEIVISSEVEKSFINVYNRMITLNKDFSIPLRFSRNDKRLFDVFHKEITANPLDEHSWNSEAKIVEASHE